MALSGTRGGGKLKEESRPSQAQIDAEAIAAEGNELIVPRSGPVSARMLLARQPEPTKTDDTASTANTR